MYKGWVVLPMVVAASVLTGCGGGGGSDNKQKPGDTVELSGSGTGGSPGSSSPLTPPMPVWSADTDSYMTALSAGMRDTPTKAEVAMTILPSGATYVLDIQSGVFNGSWFTTDQHLDAAQIPLQQTSRELIGFKTTQFEGTMPLPGNHAYAVSIQTLTDAGFGEVGIGHWKFVGDSQPGYFSGTHMVHGAFLVGQPSSPAAVASAVSGVYTGFSQAGGESHWFDAFDQAAMKTSVQYDAQTHRISIRLSGMNYWYSYFELDGRMSISWDSGSQPAFVQAGAICSGPVDPTTGTFTCDMASNLSGRIKGRFFGPHGEYIAGTYMLRGGITSPISDDGLVGGFVAKLTTATSSPPTGAAWHLTTPSLSFSNHVANVGSATLHVNASNIEGRTVYAAAIDAAGDINPNVSLTQTNGGFSAYDITVNTNRSTTVGSRSAALQLRMCFDDPLVCAQPVSGSPWSIPYQIDTKPYPGPGITFTPGGLDGVTYDGQLLNLGASIVINQPSVIDGSFASSSQQYRYTVLDSGVLTPTSPTGYWYNQMPNSFADSVLRFTLQPGESVGIYEGVVNVAVCGFSYADQQTCLPVEQPTLTIPYKVEVKSWTNTRALGIAPEIAAQPNQRASANERLTFPLTVNPQDIASRWKAPDHYDLVGIGQGFVFGLANNLSDNPRLDVLSEDDGHLIWRIDLPKGSQFTDDSYGRYYAVSASNNRLYVRLGEGYGFVLLVYDAATGKLLLEKHCPDCQRLMEQEYAKGWVVHVLGPQYHPNMHQVWIYDAQSNSVTVTPLQSDGLSTADRTTIRNMMLDGAPTGAPAAVGTSALCADTPNIFPYPRQTAYSAACYYPALSGARWSLEPLQEPGSTMWLQGQVTNPLEAGGNVVSLLGRSVVVRDAKDGHELKRIQDQVNDYGLTTMARSSNLLFLAQDVRVAAIDIATSNVVWTLPYAGRIVGISNAGVLYVRLTFGNNDPLTNNGQLVAINLRP